MTPEQARAYSLRRFGLTPADYDIWFDVQNGVCAICRRPPKKNRRLAVDHNHRTKEVRGLLCTRCNVGLGLFGDSRSRIFTAYEYLSEVGTTSAEIMKMKMHTKRKAYRRLCKKNAQDGKINNAQGQWVPRSSIADSSMRRDYSPQSGKA